MQPSVLSCVAARSHRHDRHFGDHSVGEDPVRRVLALLVARGDRRVVRLDQSESLAESLAVSLDESRFESLAGSLVESLVESVV